MQSPPASLTLQSISLQVGVPASTCHTYRHWAVPEAGRCGKGVSLLRPGSDHASHALQVSAQPFLAIKTQKGVGRPTTTLENRG